MFIVKETTTETSATFGYPDKAEAHTLCDSYNFHAANDVWNEMNYVVEEVPDNEAFKAYPF